MKSTITLLCLLFTMSLAHAGKLSDQVPECSVHEEPNCNEVHESVGDRMDCYKDAIRRKKICEENSKPILDAMEAELKAKQEELNNLQQ